MTVKNYKLKSINPLFEVYKIPFNAIEKANISLKDKDNTWSLKEHSDEQGWDIAVNGAMFSNGNKATDKTIEYVADDYRYGDEAIIKLAEVLK